MSIDRGEVERIAALARLEIAEEAMERTARQLSEVLEFVTTLRQLDLEGCEPTAFAPPEAPLREDLLDGRRLPAEVALAAAPSHEDGFFLVPPIVENVNP
jgi:aspartyl-tRNA(Asn)/glutamyl-tRNA(Gln) amidotransferase subunit C